MITMPELNEFNRKHWGRQKLLMQQRMANAGVLEAAIEDLDSELKRGVPTKYQKTFEFALADAERSRQRFGLALKGGRAAKIDPLQKLILEIVRHCPHISWTRLLDQLKQREGQGTIDDIADGRIYFKSQAPENTGRIKSAKEKVTLFEAPISGLKHRLTRAKRKNAEKTQSR